MSDIPEPKISPAFTLEDIRKIRDWDDERHKRMTPQEICEDTRRHANKFFSSRQPDPARSAEIQHRIDEARQRRASREKHKKAS